MIHLDLIEEWAVVKIGQRGYSAGVDCSGSDQAHPRSRPAVVVDYSGLDQFHQIDPQIVAAGCFGFDLIPPQTDRQTVDCFGFDRRDRRVEAGSVAYCQTILRLVVVDFVCSAPSSQIAHPFLGSVAYSGLDC